MVNKNSMIFGFILVLFLFSISCICVADNETPNASQKSVNSADQKSTETLNQQGNSSINSGHLQAVFFIGNSTVVSDAPLHVTTGSSPNVDSVNIKDTDNRTTTKSIELQSKNETVNQSENTNTTVSSSSAAILNISGNGTPTGKGSISIPYVSLLKNPDSYKGTSYNVSGYVSQAVDATDYVVKKQMGTRGQGIEVWVNYDDCITGHATIPEIVQLYSIDEPLGRKVTKGDRISVNCVALDLFTYVGEDGVSHTIPGAGVTSGKFI